MASINLQILSNLQLKIFNFRHEPYRATGLIKNMSELREIRKKSEEELQGQTNEVASNLEQEIIQPTSREVVFSMSLSEIKERFPVRYGIYLKSLRANKTGTEIPEEEKQEMQEWLSVLNNLDKYIENHKTNGEEVTLRERQFTVFEDMRDFLEEGGKEGYIKLPTGAGKTVIFSEFIEAIGVKTLIVVPTKLLVEQTEGKLEEFAEDLDVGKIYSEAKKHGKDVTIITYQSLVKKLEDGTLNPDDYRCLILDEVHTALSEKRSDAVGKFNKAIKLGFTATPKYSEHKNVEQLLNTEIHSLNVREAAEEGVISPFSVVIAQTNIDISGVKVKNKSGEYDEYELQKAINIQSRNQSAVELYQKMFDGQLAVVYCMGVKHAKNVAKLFNDSGISASVVHGNQSIKEQQIILEKYKQGEIKVLCNADILVAGFDEPRVSVCLNLAPTLSPVTAEQRGGRALRLDKEDKDKHATIVDFIDRNENKKVQPITFAEITGASVVYPSSKFRDSKSRIKEGGGKTIQSPEIEIEGLKVTTNSEEVMRIVVTMMEGRAEPAPEGWMARTPLATKLGLGKETVNEMVDKYRQQHPEWFHKYLDDKNRINEYYAPELVALAEEKVATRKYAPQGWITAGTLAKKTSASRSKIFGIADKYRNEHPEWFEGYLDKSKHSYEHYSPELVQKIQSEVETQVKPPSGWATSGILNKKSKPTVGLLAISRMAEEHRQQHPEWFKEFLNEMGLMCEHYSPELINIIEGKIRERKKIPAGWVNNNTLAIELGFAPVTTNRIAEQHREQHPEWFEWYFDHQGRNFEYYSPELTGIIREILITREKAPIGWVTKKFLAKELSMSPQTIHRRAEQHREQHPEWFKSYINKKGGLFEHYSPELVKTIKEELKSK